MHASQGDGLCNDMSKWRGSYSFSSFRLSNLLFHCEGTQIHNKMTNLASIDIHMHCTCTLHEDMTHRYVLNSTKAPRNGSCAISASNEAAYPEL